MSLRHNQTQRELKLQDHVSSIEAVQSTQQLPLLQQTLQYQPPHPPGSSTTPPTLILSTRLPPSSIVFPFILKCFCFNCLYFHERTNKSKCTDWEIHIRLWSVVEVKRMKRLVCSRLTRLMCGCCPSLYTSEEDT